MKANKFTLKRKILQNKNKSKKKSMKGGKHPEGYFSEVITPGTPGTPGMRVIGDGSLKTLSASDITQKINDIGSAGLTGVSHIEEKFLLAKAKTPGIDKIDGDSTFHNLFREDKHHDEVCVLKSTVIKEANHEDNLIRQGDVVPDVLKLSKAVSNTDMLNHLNYQHTYGTGNVNIPEGFFLCLVKDVFDKVKCIPGINSCIDPAGHTHEGYIEHIGLPKKIGNILKKKNTINHIIENGGFIKYTDTQSSVADEGTFKNPDDDNKKRVAHLFTAYFNYDVLIFYEIMKQIQFKNAARFGELHKLVFGNDIDESKYANYDTFLDFFRVRLVGNTSKIIKNINVVAINYLWQKLMCMSFLGLISDDEFSKLLSVEKYGELITLMREVSFTDFDYSSSTHYPIFKFKHDVDSIAKQIYEHFKETWLRDISFMFANITYPKKNNLIKYSTSQAVVAIRMLKVIKDNKVKGDFNNIHPRSKNPKGESNKCVDAIMEFLILNINTSNNIINTVSICTGLSTLKIIGDSSHSELGEIIQSGLNRIETEIYPIIPKVLFLLQERPFLGRMCYMKRNFCLEGQPNVVKEIYPGSFNENDYLLHFAQSGEEIIESIKNSIKSVLRDSSDENKEKLKAAFNDNGDFQITDNNGNLTEPTPATIDELKKQYNALMKEYQKLKTIEAIRSFDTDVDFQKYGGFWGRRITSAINYKTIIDDFISPNNDIKKVAQFVQSLMILKDTVGKLPSNLRFTEGAKAFLQKAYIKYNDLDLKRDESSLYNQFFKYSTESPPFPTGPGKGESVRLECANTMEYIVTSLYSLFKSSIINPVDLGTQGGGAQGQEIFTDLKELVGLTTTKEAELRREVEATVATESEITIEVLRQQKEITYRIVNELFGKLAKIRGLAKAFINKDRLAVAYTNVEEVSLIDVDLSNIFDTELKTELESERGHIKDWVDLKSFLRELESNSDKYKGIVRKYNGTTVTVKLLEKVIQFTFNYRNTVLDEPMDIDIEIQRDILLPFLLGKLTQDKLQHELVTEAELSCLIGTDRKCKLLGDDKDLFNVLVESESQEPIYKLNFTGDPQKFLRNLLLMPKYSDFTFERNIEFLEYYLAERDFQTLNTQLIIAGMLFNGINPKVLSLENERVELSEGEGAGGEAGGGAQGGGAGGGEAGGGEAGGEEGAGGGAEEPPQAPTKSFKQIFQEKNREEAKESHIGPKTIVKNNTTGDNIVRSVEKNPLLSKIKSIQKKIYDKFEYPNPFPDRTPEVFKLLYYECFDLSISIRMYQSFKSLVDEIKIIILSKRGGGDETDETPTLEQPQELGYWQEEMKKLKKEVMREISAFEKKPEPGYERLDTSVRLKYIQLKNEIKNTEIYSIELLKYKFNSLVTDILGINLDSDELTNEEIGNIAARFNTSASLVQELIENLKNLMKSLGRPIEIELFDAKVIDVVDELKLLFLDNDDITSESYYYELYKSLKDTLELKEINGDELTLTMLLYDTTDKDMSYAIYNFIREMASPLYKTKVALMKILRSEEKSISQTAGTAGTAGTEPPQSALFKEGEQKIKTIYDALSELEDGGLALLTYKLLHGAQQRNSCKNTHISYELKNFIIECSKEIYGHNTAKGNENINARDKRLNYILDRDLNAGFNHSLKDLVMSDELREKLKHTLVSALMHNCNEEELTADEIDETLFDRPKGLLYIRGLSLRKSGGGARTKKKRRNNSKKQIRHSTKKRQRKN